MKGLLFTYLLTYGGAATSLFRPYYGLLIYICFAIIKPEALWHWSVPAGNYSRIVAIALLLGWAINGFGKFKFGKGKWIVISLVAFWLWAIPCTLTAANQQVGIRFLENMAKIVLPVVVGATLIENLKQLKQLAWTIVLSLGYVCFELNMSYFQGFNQLGDYGFGGMDNNSYTIGIVSGVGLAFFLGFGSEKTWTKLLAFGCAALMAHAVFFSFSRGGMLSLCIVGAVSFWLIPKRPSTLALFAVGVVVALMMAGPEVTEEFLSTFTDAEERDESAQSRIDMWKICLNIMASNPITGIGPDHFTVMASSFGLTQGKEAHTLWLQIGAEMGVPGLFFLLMFYISTVWMLWRFLRNTRKQKFADEFTNHIPRMVIASLVGFMVAAQFVSLEGLEIPYYVALLGIGAIKVNSLGKLPVKRQRRRVIMVPQSTPQPSEPVQV